MIAASLIQSYKTYLQFERNLASNTVEAYIRDIELLDGFLNGKKEKVHTQDISTTDIQDFLGSLFEMGVGARSQARIISGLKGFFKYLIIEKVREDNPVDLIDSPRLGLKLPEVLSLEEIMLMMEGIDLSKPLGHRNRAILELLYGCGLRVTELIRLQLSKIYRKEYFLSIIGKGDKQRLVPIGEITLKYLDIYIEQERNQLARDRKFEDVVFLNSHGGSLSRQMVFLIVRKTAAKAGIKKPIGPHTFRHSFASHLVDRGADLRSVQLMLGHESITTTEIYTHLSQQYLQQTIRDYHPRSR